ncbi:MAG TPA: hypothetical protein PKJ58_12540, partial [Prolixibacteraceae bacterium]|nr:hypothetical protein [Prolixibacteraceae bacterium]
MKINPEKLPRLLTWSLAALALLSFLWWLTWDPTRSLTQSLPGMDNRGAGGAGDTVLIGALFDRFSDEYTPLGETWPRFRGATFD